jgi:hypothetical protein
MIFTSGGMGSILKEKLFWAVGPQCIGMVIGLMIGIYCTAEQLSRHVFK